MLHKMQTSAYWLDYAAQQAGSMISSTTEQEQQAMEERLDSVATEQAQQSIEQTVEESGFNAIRQQTGSIETSATEQVPHSIDAPLEACTTEQVQESIEESAQEAGLDDNAQPGLWDAGSAMDPASPAPLFRPSEQFLARAAEERARGARGPAEGARTIDRIWRCRLCRHGPACQHPACGLAHALCDLLPPQRSAH